MVYKFAVNWQLKFSGIVLCLVSKFSNFDNVQIYTLLIKQHLKLMIALLNSISVTYVYSLSKKINVARVVCM